MYRKRRQYSNQSKVTNQKQSEPSKPGVLSTMKETIVAGFGLGVGNEIAHRAVSSILGPRTVEVQYSNVSNTCQEQLQKYEKCLKQNNCIDELESYQSCIKSR